MYFRNYGLRKTWLNKCLKSPVRHSTCGMFPKTCEICMTAPLLHFSVSLGESELKNVSVRYMWNLRTVYYHIESRWQEFSS